MESYKGDNSSCSSTCYAITEMYQKKDEWGNTLVSNTDVSSPWKEFLPSTLKCDDSDTKNSEGYTYVYNTQMYPSWSEMSPFTQRYDDSYNEVSLLKDRIRFKKKKLEEIYERSKCKFDSVKTFMSALTWVMDEINKIEEHEKYGTTGEF